MTSDYLELDTGQMVDLLRDIQKKSREMMRAAKAVPFSIEAHRKAVDALFQKSKWLAEQGDII